MRLLHSHDLPRHGVRSVYRHSRLTPLSIALGSAVFTGYWVHYLNTHNVPMLLWIPVAGGVIVSGVALAMARASLRATNWLMLCTGDAVYLHLRSYLNYRIPETGPTVLELRWDDIAEAGVTRLRQTAPDSQGGDVSYVSTYLDFAVPSLRLEELTSILKNELNLTGSTGKRSSVKVHDYPVRIVGGQTIRVQWSGVPGVDRAARELSGHVHVRAETRKKDTPWSSMNPEQQDGLIAEMAGRGDRMAAIRMARIRHGLSVTEAKKFVESLSGDSR